MGLRLDMKWSGVAKFFGPTLSKKEKKNFKIQNISNVSRSVKSEVCSLYELLLHILGLYSLPLTEG